jgi:histidinol-phosphatase (PHP family)
MILQNYHTHCNLCDGKDTLKDIVEKGIELNIKVLGFSSHSPLPFKQDWVLSKENLQIYLNELEKLKNNYLNKISIKKGLEVDYIPNTLSPEKVKNDYKLDYVIGSIHFVEFDINNPITVDSSFEDFKILLKNYYKNNIKNLIEDYLNRISQMCKNNKIDIIGHFDLFKKNNRKNIFFNQNDNWYIDLIEETLKKIKKYSYYKNNVLLPLFEINTGGMARKYLNEPYPSYKILKLLNKYGFSIIINTDCHDKNYLLYFYKESIEIAKEAGFKHICSLDENNNWININL